MPIVVTGTDTGVGKTVFAAGLCDLLSAHYWKPVQAGLDSETDSKTVARLAALTPAHVLPEAYRLNLPASPHLAAEREGLVIDIEALTPPPMQEPLVVEGAGGALVPLTRTVTYADVFARWRCPVVLCARTALGTINHTLLSLEALRRREISVLGVAFIGDARPETEEIIGEMGAVRILGRLPMLERLDALVLRQQFRQAFHANDYLA
jgi:dethiobiotin synthetase